MIEFSFMKILLSHLKVGRLPHAVRNSITMRKNKGEQKCAQARQDCKLNILLIRLDSPR